MWHKFKIFYELRVHRVKYSQNTPKYIAHIDANLFWMCVFIGFYLNRNNIQMKTYKSSFFSFILSIKRYIWWCFVFPSTTRETRTNFICLLNLKKAQQIQLDLEYTQKPWWLYGNLALKTALMLKVIKRFLLQIFFLYGWILMH